MSHEWGIQGNLFPDWFIGLRLTWAYRSLYSGKLLTCAWIHYSRHFGALELDLHLFGCGISLTVNDER